MKDLKFYPRVPGLGSDDICHCSNNSCPLRDRCRRARQPIEEYVTIAEFKFDNVELCDHFWDISHLIPPEQM